MGVTVTVLTWPVTVSREVIGVGVHVEDVDDEVWVVCVLDLLVVVVVAAAAMVVDVDDKVVGFVSSIVCEFKNQHGTR